jgi:hypothetical protein
VKVSRISLLSPRRFGQLKDFESVRRFRHAEPLRHVFLDKFSVLACDALGYILAEFPNGQGVQADILQRMLADIPDGNMHVDTGKDVAVDVHVQQLFPGRATGAADVRIEVAADARIFLVQVVDIFEIVIRED